MAIQKYPHVIFEEACEIKNREERIEYMKNNAYKQVKTILQLAYNDNIVLDLPKGKPPFTPCPEGREPQSVKNAFAPIGMCVVGNKIDKVKKEKIFISILESIPEETAKILIAAKDGNLLTLKGKKYSKITKPLVQECFPEIL
jgi:hypothetical protein